MLGKEVTNHGPRQAWAKIPDSINNAMRHLDNDPVFHKAQRVGPNDAPNPDPVSVALFRAALAEDIALFNADTVIRTMGAAAGECRNATLQRFAEGRQSRWPTPLHIRQLRCKWHLDKITKEGQVVVKGNT